MRRPDMESPPGSSAECIVRYVRSVIFTVHTSSSNQYSRVTLYRAAAELRFHS
jgi:hypothetical protein